eukprot:jgi/Picsp_1/5779/NSC_03138-R1_ion channel
MHEEIVSEHASVDTVGPEISPLSLWTEYISQRKPVLIDGQPSEEGWGLSRWSDEYLKAKCGHRFVSVEYRKSLDDDYGKGNRREMEFSEFIGRVQNEEQKFYLTSPEQTIGPYGFPDVMVSPTLDLSSDFPIRPKIAGNLIPNQINLWFGYSSCGSSTGLHHDFHDNFYILLRGKKVFKLYPPEMIHCMYTYGQPSHVYPNGRIVYSYQEGILPDGSHQADVAGWKQGSPDQDAEYDDFVGIHSDRKDKTDWRGKDPPSFSRVDLKKDFKDILSDFPKFPKSCITCTVHAGQTLYLPAGWFHEVTSMSTGKGDGHMALNYWFHPPDNLAGGKDGFLRPYRCKFWEDMWENGMIGGTKHVERKKKRRKMSLRRLSRLRRRFGKHWCLYYYQ